MEFRKDINGLRAIAVIGVVLFHFNSEWLVGGFSGVDVFFVISGFLMTKIIISGLETGNFSIPRFYLSRAKRILPALTVMSLVVLIFGWFYLSHIDFRMLGKHVASSVTFLSNFIYLSESGYFDSSSHEKWLLHTWSLSVEWQFYIIYPVALLAVSKLFNLKVAKYLIVLGTVGGFVFCAVATTYWPSHSFYLLPTRAWEMLLGGVAFLYPINLTAKKRMIFEGIGLMLISVGYVFISSENLWPGYLALIPALGAYIVITSYQKDSIITGNHVFQKIGLYSYSIYLWHWPVVVLINYVGLHGVAWSIFGIMVSLFLGYASYVLVEKKFAFQIPNTNILSVITYKPVYTSLLVCILGLGVYHLNGLPVRLDTQTVIAANEFDNRNSYGCIRNPELKLAEELCFIGNKNNVKAIIVGDSHANALTSSLVSAVDLNKESVIAFTMHACPFVLGLKHKNYSTYNCDAANRFSLKEITERYPHIPVFVINRTSVYLFGQSNPKRVKNNDLSPDVYFDMPFTKVNDKLLQGFSDRYINTVCELSDSNNIFVTNPVPEMRLNVPKTLAKGMLLLNDKKDISIEKSEYLKRNSYALNLIQETKAACGVNILEIEKYLCKDGKCMGSVDGRPLYYDGDHMSEYGNKLLTPMFKSALEGSISTM